MKTDLVVSGLEIVEPKPPRRIGRGAHPGVTTAGQHQDRLPKVGLGDPLQVKHNAVHRARGKCAMRPLAGCTTVRHGEGRTSDAGASDYKFATGELVTCVSHHDEITLNTPPRKDRPPSPLVAAVDLDLVPRKSHDAGMISRPLKSYSPSTLSPRAVIQLPDRFLENTIRAWSTAGLLAGAVCLLLLAVKHLLGRRLTALAKRTTTDVDDVAAELITKVRWYFILALALRSGSIALALSTQIDRAIRQVAAIAVLLQLAVWGNALIGFWLRKWAMRRGTTAGAATLNAIGFAAKGLLWAVIGVLALRNVLDYDITALLTGLGVGGIAIALAVQNVLGDLFAALSIVLDRPFEEGDTIAVDSFTGVVEHIGLKTTRIRSTGGEQVIFSNADLLRSRVRNLKRIEERRAVLTLGITYDTPAERVASVPAVLRTCVETQPLARFERAHFSRFAESWLEFEVVYLVRSPAYEAYMDTQQAVNLAVLRAFSAEGIAFAFPTRTLRTVKAEE